jgi:periplasmic divalent cation tolerance protein
MSDALVTHPEAGAQAFARGLVDLRLAACVNLLRAESVFRWQGSVSCETEVLLVVKTLAERLPELERHIQSQHPYDVPELVALEPAAVEARYLAWLRAEVLVQ